MHKLLKIMTITVLSCLALYLAQIPRTTAEAASIHSTGNCQVLRSIHVGHKSYASCLSITGHTVQKPPSPQSCPNTKGNHLTPNCTFYGNCPTGRIYASAYNTNQAKFSGTATNNCGFELMAGLIEVTVDIYCPATSPGGAEASVGIGTWPAGVTHNYSFTATGYCEECTDGVPTAFPQFTLFGNLIVSGRYAGNLFINDPADTTNITMANSPAYPFPCA